jgi:hypothetical protein
MREKYRVFSGLTWERLKDASALRWLLARFRRFRGLYLGKVIRWYYSTEMQGEINRATKGDKIPNTDRSRPPLWNCLPRCRLILITTDTSIKRLKSCSTSGTIPAYGRHREDAKRRSLPKIVKRRFI